MTASGPLFSISEKAASSFIGIMIALGSMERGFLVQDIAMVRRNVGDGQIVGTARI